MLVAWDFYSIWWLWQLFNFTRRESFPRARKFWWILIPFYGVYLLYQQFDDIKAKAQQASGHSFNAVLAGWLAFIGLYGGGEASQPPGWVGVLLLVLGGLALAAAAYPVQQAANAYIVATYPTEKQRQMTPGEIVAAALGILVLALFVVGAVLRLPSSS
jgi:hypothetical protein